MWYFSPNSVKWSSLYWDQQHKSTSCLTCLTWSDQTNSDQNQFKCLCRCQSWFGPVPFCIEMHPKAIKPQITNLVIICVWSMSVLALCLGSAQYQVHPQMASPRLVQCNLRLLTLDSNGRPRHHATATFSFGFFFNILPTLFCCARQVAWNGRSKPLIHCPTQLL